MLDSLSTHDAVFPTIYDEGPATVDLEGAPEVLLGRPGREPIYSVETLMEGRSAQDAVFQNATQLVRR